MRSLIDPRMKRRTDHLWPSRCTIKEVMYKRTSANQRVRDGVKILVGLDDIPCRSGPYVDARPTDRELRERAVTAGVLLRHVKLNSYYPGIKSEMLAVVDGEEFDILGVEHDSEHVSTRLLVTDVKPN